MNIKPNAEMLRTTAGQPRSAQSDLSPLSELQHELLIAHAVRSIRCVTRVHCATRGMRIQCAPIHDAVVGQANALEMANAVSVPSTGWPSSHSSSDTPASRFH